MPDRIPGLSLGFFQRRLRLPQLGGNRLDLGELGGGVEFALEFGDAPDPKRELFLRGGHGR
jgi:hypothetical protein